MALASLLAACGGSSIDEPIPQLSAASPAALKSCSDLLRTMKYPNTGITEAVIVPAGTLKTAGTEISEHCLVAEKMFERVNSEDGQRYAIGFEMRLPVPMVAVMHWSQPRVFPTNTTVSWQAILVSTYQSQALPCCIQRNN